MSRPDRHYNERQLVSRLCSIDWNFRGSTTPPSSVHALHWFPGNFIPQIPSHLIEILSEPGDLVLDPFCGSGTTGIEAAVLGRRSLQSDVNRAAVALASGKLAFLSTSELLEGFERFGDSLPPGPLFARKSLLERVNGPELSLWFHPDTLAELDFLWSLILKEEGGLRAALQMLFTDLLFSCASTRRSVTASGAVRKHHWGWIADNVMPKDPIRHDVWQLFMGRLEHAQFVAMSMRDGLHPDDHRVMEENFLMSSVPDNAIDLIVTSPPYIGMIDYAMANRLTYLWHGWNMEEDREAEIGARWKRGRRSLESSYLKDMEACFAQMKRVLRPQGLCAIVVGASTTFPEALDSLLEVACRRLRLVWGPVARVPSRRRVSRRDGERPTELVAVFCK